MLREEWTEEFTWAWSVWFDTQEYLDTGDIRPRPIHRALYVRKDTGEVRFVPGGITDNGAAYFLETGIFPPPPEVDR